MRSREHDRQPRSGSPLSSSPPHGDSDAGAHTGSFTDADAGSLTNADPGPYTDRPAVGA
jgi:hypothetical protein